MVREVRAPCGVLGVQANLNLLDLILVGKSLAPLMCAGLFKELCRDCSSHSPELGRQRYVFPRLS